MDETTLYTGAYTVLGLIIGSFVNVLIHRLPEKKDFVFTPSACPHCDGRIRWYDNIPLVSYVLLRGRCRKCSGKISLRYPLVELITAVLFFATALRFGISAELLFYHLPWIVIAVSVIFIDLKHRIIPDILSLGGIALGLIVSSFVQDIGLTTSVIGACSGFGFFAFFSYGYYFLTGRIGLGGGDVKFLGTVGAFLGFSGVFATVLLSSVVGSVVGIGYGVLAGKRGLLRVSLPYGPFLVAGAMIYYYFRNHEWLQYMIPT
jgi:leader peptidase (prepilin peptidase) / N-methyltransferase